MARGVNDNNNNTRRNNNYNEKKRSTTMEMKSNTKWNNRKKDDPQPNPSEGATPRVKQVLLPPPRIQAEFIDLLVEELKQKNLPKNLTVPVVLKTLSHSLRAIPFEHRSLRMAIKERIHNHAVRVYEQLRDMERNKIKNINNNNSSNNKLNKEKQANPFSENRKDTDLNVLSLLTSNTGQNLPLFLKESVIKTEIPTDSIVNAIQRLSLSLMVSCENMQGQIDSVIKLVEIFNSRVIKTTANVTPQHFTLIHRSLKNYISLCHNLLTQSKNSDRETCEDLLVDLLSLFIQITSTFPQSSLLSSNSNSSSSSSSSSSSNSSEADLLFILSTLLLETTNDVDISHENSKSSKSDHKNNHTSYSLPPRTHSPSQVAKLLEILYTLPLESSAITKNGKNALAPKIVTSLLSLTKAHPPTKPDTFMKFVITLLRAKEMFRNVGDKSMLDETSARIFGLNVPREIAAITNKDPSFIEYSVEDAQRLYDNILGNDRELQTIGYLIDKQRMDNERAMK